MLGSSRAFPECVRALDRAIKLKATDPELFVRRGTCKHQLPDEPGAEQDFEASLKIDPKFAAGHYYLGLSLLARKSRQKATLELTQAAKLGASGPIGKAAKEKLDELSKMK
jgi:Flp pilus assembly protein TadD